MITFFKKTKTCLHNIFIITYTICKNLNNHKIPNKYVKIQNIEKTYPGGTFSEYFRHHQRNE